MTNEELTTALLALTQLNPDPGSVGIAILAACIFHTGCANRAIRLVQAVESLVKALRD